MCVFVCVRERGKREREGEESLGNLRSYGRNVRELSFHRKKRRKKASTHS